MVYGRIPIPDDTESEARQRALAALSNPEMTKDSVAQMPLAPTLQRGGLLPPQSMVPQLSQPEQDPFGSIGSAVPSKQQSPDPGYANNIKDLLAKYAQPVLTPEQDRKIGIQTLLSQIKGGLQQPWAGSSYRVGGRDVGPVISHEDLLRQQQAEQQQIMQPYQMGLQKQNQAKDAANLLMSYQNLERQNKSADIMDRLHGSQADELQQRNDINSSVSTAEQNVLLKSIGNAINTLDANKNRLDVDVYNKQKAELVDAMDSVHKMNANQARAAQVAYDKINDNIKSNAELTIKEQHNKATEDEAALMHQLMAASRSGELEQGQQRILLQLLGLLQPKGSTRLSVTDRSKLQKEMSNMDYTLQNLDEMEKLLSKINTGPLRGRLGEFLANNTNSADPDFRRFNTLLKRSFVPERKEITGVSFSPLEARDITPFIPDVTQSESKIADNLRALKEKLQFMRQARQQQLEDDDKTTGLPSGISIGGNLTPKNLSELLAQILAAKGGNNKTPLPKPPMKPLSEKDQAALKWADEHPDDPRAKAIRQAHGAK